MLELSYICEDFATYIADAIVEMMSPNFSRARIVEHVSVNLQWVKHFLREMKVNDSSPNVVIFISYLSDFHQ